MKFDLSTNINSQDLVVDRLRQLQERLNSLGSGDHSDVEPILGMLAIRESNRGKAYAEVLRNATSFALDVSKSVDAKVAARLERTGDRAIAMLETQTPQIELEQTERILRYQEARVAPLAQQFAEVRASAVKLEERLARAGEALDQVWKQQDTTGLGGWRMVMRSVSTKVEMEKESAPSLVDQYRGTPFVEANIPAPAANIVCRRCKQVALRRVERVSLLEEMLRVVFISPYCCGHCGEHSYHFRYMVKTAG